jgi:hypothetical protein
MLFPNPQLRQVQPSMQKLKLKLVSQLETPPAQRLQRRTTRKRKRRRMSSLQGAHPRKPQLVRRYHLQVSLRM